MPTPDPTSATTAASAEAGSAAGRTRALFDATTAILRCDDLPSLGRVMAEAVGSVFTGARGGLTLASAEAEEATTEIWSDDPDAVDDRAWLEASGGRSGFSLPVRTSAGVVGSTTVVFDEERTFEPDFREMARSLCAQAGLSYELIAARDELRRNATALDGQRRIATALLDVASRLAAITEPEGVPQALVAAIRAATGAATAGVALRVGDKEEFRIVALEGHTPEQAAILAGTPLTPEHFPSLRPLLDGQSLAGSESSKMAVRLELGGGAAAPIMLDGAMRGFLSFTVAPGDPFDVETWHELATGFASIGATALARAEAVAELQAQRTSLASAVAERTDQLREANEELWTVSQAKIELLANVSHELRTPLTAILGFSEVLVTGLDGPLNPRQHEDASTILSSSRRLVELIDDLIDISQIEADRIELRTQPVDVAAVLSTVAEEVRPLAGQKGIGLALEEVSEGLEIEADSIRIHSIVLHLVSNAVKFTPTGGTVRICAATESATGDDARPMLRIDVSDTGIGIAAEDQDRIFEKFHRLGGAEHQGTGLGLAIARHLTNLHGGSLTVESTLGLGSTFSVRIPLARRTTAPS